jgi:hypothetical protein
MKSSILSLCAVAIVFLASICHAAPTTQPYDRISGPYPCKNLTLFLIHGPDTIKGGENYLTLQEALEQKKVIVYETGNVNELAIENVGDQPVFIQSGDIVKGGRQDRTIGTDMIVSAHSGKVPIASFCVEHGRWTGRQGEVSANFGASADMVATPAMKLAANVNTGYADQSTVWAKVSENQKKLSENVGATVASTTSPSSFQLTLESGKLRETTDQYLQELQPSIDGKDDVIGYAFAVNGKISSADIFGSHALFVKLWPKLIKSAAVEALAELNPDGKVTTNASDEDVKKFLDEPRGGKADRKQVNDRTEATSYDVPGAVMIQTDDKETASTGIRRTYIAKPAAESK